MESQIKVSIVTVTYNLIQSGRAASIVQNIESVHNQTHRNIEHIVVDGGSRDGTVELLHKYFSCGWIKFVSESDNGIYEAMNKGVKLSTGKYVAFLNSDDYYHDSRAVQASVTVIEQSGADFSYAPVHIIDEKCNLGTYIHPHSDPRIGSVFYLMPFCHQTMFTRKSVLELEHGFDENYKSAGDYDLVIRLCLKGYRAVKVPLCFTTFRVGGISDTNQHESSNEVATIYFRNYSRFSQISEDECHNIYCKGFKGITPELAWKLKGCKQYFDFYGYWRWRIRKMIQIRSKKYLPSRNGKSSSQDAATRS